MAEQLLEAFALLFVTLNPISTAVYFAGASASSDSSLRNHAAFKSVAIAFGILLAFALGGDDLLRLVGIRLFSLKIAGGIMLFLFGVGMVMGPKAKGATDAGKLEDQVVFPLAMPIMAGPASILTTVILIEKSGGDFTMQGIIIGIVALVMLITLTLLFLGAKISKLLGESGNEILSRILGLLLAALAVEMIIDGLVLAEIIKL